MNASRDAYIHYGGIVVYVINRTIIRFMFGLGRAGSASRARGGDGVCRSVSPRVLELKGRVV